MRAVKKTITYFLISAFLLNVILPVNNAYSMTAPWWAGSQATDTTTIQAPPPGETSQTDNRKNQEKAGEPVSVHNGDFIYQRQDILIPSRAIPTEITRTYKSQSRYNNRYGYGWDISCNKKIIPLCNGDLFYINGALNRYRFVYIDGTNYTSPKGIYDKIIQNQDGTYTLKERQGTTYIFDQNGLLSEIRDRNSNSLHFSYDPLGKTPIIGKSPFSNDPDPKVIAYDYTLVKVTDTVGREITLSYDDNGRLITIIDYSGRTYTYTYDASNNGDLATFTMPPTQDYPQGATTSYTYTNHNLVTIRDSKNQIYLTNYYDTSDRVYKQDYAQGTFFFSYDTANRKTTLTSPKGFVTEWSYDADGSPITKKEYTTGLRSTDPASYTTTYQNNNTLERTLVTYPSGNGVKYTFDEENPDIAKRANLLQARRKEDMTKPDDNVVDQVTTYTYESRYNFIKTMTDPKANTTTYTYDYELPPDDPSYNQSGNLVKITYPTVNSITPEVRFAYNSYGQPLTITDPNGNVTKYEYYPDTGYLNKITRGFGSSSESSTEHTYDVVGNVATIKDPRGDITTFEHNSHNSLTKTTSPAPFNYLTKYKYDANDNLIQTDRETGDTSNPWQTLLYTYDILDRIETITDDAGNTTTYGYDANGNRNLITDAELNSTTYVYDERDLLWKVIDAQGNVTRYSYDPNSNLERIQDAKFNDTTYSYDGFDRLVSTTYDDSSSESYTYDKSSNLTQKTTRKSQSISYTYDALNRLEQKASPERTITYTYDPANRLLSASDPTLGSLSYIYDALNRVNQVTFPNSKTVSYDYDTSSNRTKLTYPDSTYITYEYDELSRLKVIKDESTQAIASYTYDALSRRTGLSYANNTSTAYIYDSINRLTQLSNRQTGQPANFSQYDYTYDKVGNRLNMTSLRGGGGAADEAIYAYDKLYQLKTVDYPTASNLFDTTFNYDPLGNRTSTVNGGTTNYTSNSLNQYSQVGASAYTYDANGNLTSCATGTFAYDSENRLTSATTPNHTASYTYDPFGRRITKTVDGTITKYLYDGDDLIAEYDNAGNLITKYVYSDYIDEPIRMEKGGQSYYYHYDGLGSVTNLTDLTGTTAESYSYDVFGNPSTTSGIGNRFLFTGREYDDETGLYYYRERHYSPQIGRFLQTDPLEIDDENKYAYCYNDPVNWIDPYGLMSIRMGDDFGGPFGPDIGMGDGHPTIPSYLGGMLSGHVYANVAGGALIGAGGMLPGTGGVIPGGNVSPNPKIIKLPGVSLAGQGVSERATEEAKNKGKGDNRNDPPKKSWWDKLKDWWKGLRGKDGFRIESHGPHKSKDGTKHPHNYPHLQLIKGPGRGKTIDRFPRNRPW